MHISAFKKIFYNKIVYVNDDFLKKISNIFVNHKNHISKIHSWNNGYFFEREIYNVYTFEQIEKIKSLEIKKLKHIL